MNADPGRAHEFSQIFISGLQNVLGNYGYSAQDLSGSAWHISGLKFLVTGFSMEATRSVVYRFRDATWASMHLRVECNAISSEMAQNPALRARSYDLEPLPLADSTYISNFGTLPPPAIMVVQHGGASSSSGP